MISIPADSSNYGLLTRDRSAIRYIVIHNTSNSNDTAEANGRYFQREGINASTHFFIDRKGVVVKSVPLNKTAWSVGGRKWNDCSKTGGGRYYGKCTNDNSVSIELCDIVKKDPSDAQIQAVRSTIRYIRKYCPNAKTVIRHFDVNGKHCPVRYMDSRKWGDLYERLAVVGIVKG